MSFVFLHSTDSVFVSGSPTLTARGVGHFFGRLRLFRDVTVELRGGQSLAVTGANGSGKSTLLRILAGVLSPRRGTVRLQVKGKPLSAAAHPLHAGLVAPAVGVYEELTARETLRVLARARRLEGADRRIDAMLDTVGLAARADDPVGTYSSGMQQRVKYAAALLPRPPLLLLDEPSANLDAAGREMVDALAARQRARNRLLVVATNRPEEVDRHDRSLRIENHR